MKYICSIILGGLLMLFVQPQLGYFWGIVGCVCLGALIGIFANAIENDIYGA